MAKKASQAGDQALSPRLSPGHRVCIFPSGPCYGVSRDIGFASSRQDHAMASPGQRVCIFPSGPRYGVSGTAGLHLPVRTMLWRLRDSGFASSLLSLLCGSDGDTFAPTDLPGALGELQQSLKLSSWNWMSSQESSAQVLASDLPCRLSTPALGRNLLIPAPRTRG